MSSKIATAALFLITAASAACMLLSLWRAELPGENVVQIAALVCLPILLFAGVQIFFNPRFSYSMALIASLVLLGLLFRMEFTGLFPHANSWIALNLPSGDASPFRSLAALKILTAGLAMATVTLSFLRLLPKRWSWRNVPVSKRTWPAFAISFLLLFVWFLYGAIPFRIPIIVDRTTPELTILHVEKRGLQFHETSVSAYRDTRFWIAKNDRRLFQYRTDEEASGGVMSLDIASRARAWAESPQVTALHPGPPRALRSWNAEGWYLRTRSGIRAFTTEDGTTPPKEMIDLFQEITTLAPMERRRGDLRDACLGFCYDPLAGLGIQYLNQRCKTDDKGKTQCY